MHSQNRNNLLCTFYKNCLCNTPFLRYILSFLLSAKSVLKEYDSAIGFTDKIGLSST